MKKKILAIVLVAFMIGSIILTMYRIKQDKNVVMENGVYTKSSTINKAKPTYDNPIIPKDFKPVQTNTSNWELKEGKIGIEDLYNGLVIEDEQGSQFVWIPVNNQTITLSRKNFQKEEIQNVEQRDKIEKIYYGEENGASCLYNFGRNQEKRPYSIAYFQESVQKYGGFYIARYETGDMESIQEREEAIKGKPIVQEGMYPYTYITRNDALEQAMQYYARNDEVVSSLINSYAWDTTMQFIQQTVPSYLKSKEFTGKKQLKKTGQNEDCVCNIYDLAGNVREWTTEYSSNGYYSYLSSCVVRGGYFENQDFTAISRYYNGEFVANAYIGYRMIVYMK